MSDLNQLELQSLLSYEPATGHFIWRIRTSARAKAGVRAGTVADAGYRIIKYRGAYYKEHRLAWLYMTGALPSGDIDHRNGNRSDNRWTNLRDVSKAVNQQNFRQATARNRTGFLGVYPMRGRYAARITEIGGKKKYLGAFDTPELAYAAYLVAKRELHEGCTL